MAIRLGAVAQYDREHDTFTVISSRGLAEIESAQLAIAREHARELASFGTSLTLKDAMAEAHRFMEGHASRFTSNQIELLIPLVVRERLIGVVLLGEKASGEQFTDADLETLSALSRHIGVGIHSHHLLEEVERKADDKSPFSGLVFKIMADKHVGQLCFTRIYSGVLKSGSYVLNTTKDTKEPR